MKRLSILFIVALMLSVTSIAAALPVDFIGSFDISATIPPATQVVFVVSRITDGTPPVWEDFGEGSRALPFSMVYDDALGIWLPERFYAIDLSSRDALGHPAPGVPDLTIQYTDTKNPNNGGAAGGGTGLEAKGMVTVVRVSVAGSVESESQLYKDTFGSITTPEVIDETQFAGGWGRVYLGISDGSDGGTPFTNSDAPGDYEGTITLTATLD